MSVLKITGDILEQTLVDMLKKHCALDAETELWHELEYLHWCMGADGKVFWYDTTYAQKPTLIGKLLDKDKEVHAACREFEGFVNEKACELATRIVSAEKKLQAMNIFGEWLILNSTLYRLTPKGRTFLGLRRVITSDLPPMVMSGAQFGRFQPLAGGE